MTKRPCLDCGKPADGTYCDAHRRQRERERDRPSAYRRGYDRQHQEARAVVLAQSTICWICQHPGADQADDVVPKSKGGKGTVTNLRPAHGTRPCPTCGVRCNQSRGNRDATSDAGYAA